MWVRHPASPPLPASLSPTCLFCLTVLPGGCCVAPPDASTEQVLQPWGSLVTSGTGTSGSSYGTGFLVLCPTHVCAPEKVSVRLYMPRLKYSEPFIHFFFFNSVLANTSPLH